VLTLAIKNFHFSPARARVVLLAALPAFAHHSFTAEFNVERPVILTGTIMAIDYYNPHVQIYLDVMAEDGKIERNGISKAAIRINGNAAGCEPMLAPGTMVKIRANRAKDGTHNFAFPRNLTFLSGWMTGGER
jgi:hypothetical protein